jgi:hypothetical protein
MTTVEVKSEPLTYERHNSGVSFFRDLLDAELKRDTASRDRLDHHRSEMDVISKEREKRARSAIQAGGFEYRVEPNTTPGTGGNFSPPLWLVELFATAKRPGRVLSDLIPASFDLPNGVSSINLPVLTTGTKVRHTVDAAAVAEQAIADSPGSSVVVTIAGQADVPLQMLEQSPAGASLDWALFTDMGEAADFDLEVQLLYGRGSAYKELVGLTNVPGIVSIAYTDPSPTASEMWPFFGQAAAQLADGRLAPPQIILMRHARWQWLSTAEDTAGRPFGLPTPWYFGSGPTTPDPSGGLNGLPVFDDEAISATLPQTAPAGEDQVIFARPSDLIIFEAPPVTSVFREPLSATLGARIQLHRRVASIQNRYGSGIATVGGSGFVVQSGY